MSHLPLLALDLVCTPLTIGLSSASSRPSEAFRSSCDGGLPFLAAASCRLLSSSSLLLLLYIRRLLLGGLVLLGVWCSATNTWLSTDACDLAGLPLLDLPLSLLLGSPSLFGGLRLDRFFS